MRDITQEKEEKKELTKADWIGVIFGFGIGYIVAGIIQPGILGSFVVYSGSFYIVRSIASRFVDDASK